MRRAHPAFGDPDLSTLLEQEIDRYRDARECLLGALDDYRHWAERHEEFDAARTLRMAHLVDTLQRDRLLLAFVAEFSRGKSELINALFFANYKQRLLPSDAGRTTMCPTELFHDPAEPPSLRLLPIETRLREENIAQIKRMPMEWSTIRLDPDDTASMIAALKSLAEVKHIPKLQARAMGLWDEDDARLAGLALGDKVEVPAWRYALINFPHPLLTAGLAILDTPGLNALGAEPELTLSTIPSAHAVLFMLATDTGVTRSDMEIWNRYVRRQVDSVVAVLNKVDMLWDELKSDEEIAMSISRQVRDTARGLGLPAESVLAISAQKALLARVRGDAKLLARSGIGRLERLLAERILPARRDIAHATVLRETRAMLSASREAADARYRAINGDLAGVSALSGKNHEILEQQRDQLMAERARYEHSVTHFKITRGLVAEQGKLLKNLVGEDTVRTLLTDAFADIQSSITTAGLARGMRTLITRTGEHFARVQDMATQIQAMLGTVYERFHLQHGFPAMIAPRLDLAPYQAQLERLDEDTQDFSRDPRNVMLEKRFMVRKFYNALVSQARDVFDVARGASQSWLTGALEPLEKRIRTHKQQLDTRLANVRNMLDNIGELDTRIAALRQELAQLDARRAELSAIAARLDDAPDTAPTTRAVAA
jgi:uncharacterized small protein (DUF1192 family)